MEQSKTLPLPLRLYVTRFFLLTLGRLLDNGLYITTNTGRILEIYGSVWYWTEKALFMKKAQFLWKMDTFFEKWLQQISRISLFYKIIS